ASGRERWMDQCVAGFNSVIDGFVKSEYTPGTITFTVDLATLHLGLLRERAVFAKEIYGNELGKQRFLGDLDKAIKEYQQFFGAVAIPGELAWRLRRIETEELGYGNKIYGYYLKDRVTREVHSFAYTGRHQLRQGPAKVCVDFYRTQARNGYERE